jgi:protein ImuA
LGGVARAALHEIFASLPDDSCAASAFALLLSLRGCLSRPVLWVREERDERRLGRLYPPGLIELGASPDTVQLVTAPDTLSLLRAGADIVNCGAVGAVILEPSGKASVLDLTASRRLAMASARSGVMTLVVRSGVDPAPSAAQTRWRVSAAPSRALAANAPGPPTFDISLLRHRGGIPGFDTRVEWDRDRKVFRDAPLSSGVPAFVNGRTGVEGAARAA